MGSSRIYIGNLNSLVNDSILQEKFGQYGTVLNIDIKNKSDFDGNIISRFAYITIEADQNSILQCVNSLNGSSWKGNILKVEVAKESFLQRLKKEREQNLNKNLNIPEKVVSDILSAANDKHENQDERSFSALPRWKDVRDDWNTDNYEDRFLNKLDKNNVTQMSMRYDPTIADHEYLCSRQEKDSEIDNKLPQNCVTEKFVKVSKDLQFKGESEGFSLLAKFSKLEDKEDHCSDKFFQPMESCTDSHLKTNFPSHLPLPELYNEQQSNYFPPSSISRKVDFFVKANDPRLSDGVNWLLTPLTAENLNEFHRVRKELVDLYKLRHSRAIRQKSKTGKRFRVSQRGNKNKR